jgi:putative tryptophan/tyrosine transport system substrate-binding protein
MNRRTFLCGLTLGALAGPLAGEAQQATWVARLGWLGDDPAPGHPLLEAFLQGLRDLGYVEGRNVVIEYRFAKGKLERYPALAAELVALKVDVIVTSETSAALGAKHVTATIPIVMASSDAPVFYGLVASLARPGGNVTGLHSTARPELAGKRLQLLKEVVPGLSRVGVLLDSGDAYALLMMREIERVAQAIGVQLHSVKTRRPEEFERAFEAALLDRVDALITMEGVQTVMDRTRIVDFAAMSRLPAIYGLREFVDAGGLMAYGTDRRDLFRRAATYIDKILKGAKPADLPVEQPTKFELVINLRTAKALGLTIPPSVLGRADQVIE